MNQDLVPNHVVHGHVVDQSHPLAYHHKAAQSFTSLSTLEVWSVYGSTELTILGLDGLQILRYPVFEGRKIVLSNIFENILFSFERSIC
jgi:hypothetical protein